MRGPGPHRRVARGRLAAACLAAVLVAGCSGDALPDVDLQAVPVPDEALPDQPRLADGGWPAVAAWVRARNEEGAPVLVNAFASWCTPCRDELPLLVEAADATPGVRFLGVAHQDRRDLAEAMVDEFAIPYPTVFDRVGETVFGLEGVGMPVTALFAADGTLVRHKAGELSQEEVAAWLAAVAP